MEIKITKKRLIGKCGNCWCDYINFYLVHGRIYSDDGRYYKQFKFIAEVNFSADGWDAEENRDLSEREILENAIFSYIDCIDSFENCSYFFEICNDSIRKWNNEYRKMLCMKSGKSALPSTFPEP